MPAPPASTATEILDRLVSFDTTSHRSNLGLVEWVRGYLDGLGVASRVSLDPSGQKANLHAVIGPPGPGGVGLSGHVDTVPVDGQAWTGNPFTLRRQGGRLVGRGSTDMKGFVACCLAAVPDFLAAGLRRPIHLFVTHDEEVDCAGARRMVADLAGGGPMPAYCIVGEPTSMQPVTGHKGKLAARVTVTGRTGHSAMPARGVNAVHAAAEAVAWLTAEARRRQAEGPFADGYDPPHSTVHVGTLSGGTSLNIIPEHAAFDMEWRVIPGDDAHAEMDRLRQHVATQIEPAMHAVDPATGFAFDEKLWLPGFSLDPDSEWASRVRHLAGSNAGGVVSYGTEAGIYAQAGMATIVCGPGDIAQAHTADEWIEADQLHACDAFLRRLAVQLAA